MSTTAGQLVHEPVGWSVSSGGTDLNGTLKKGGVVTSQKIPDSNRPVVARGLGRL